MSECILHTGRVDTDGYGRVYVYAPDGSRKNRRAHRVEYEKHHGTVPPGLLVLHTCDVRRCVNIDHLYAGTHEDNMRDMRERGRARGNPFGNHCPRDQWGRFTSGD